MRMNEYASISHTNGGMNQTKTVPHQLSEYGEGEREVGKGGGERGRGIGNWSTEWIAFGLGLKVS